MHLLATTSGIVDGAAEAVDLDQPPADIIVLSTADSELATGRDLRGAFVTGGAQSFEQCLHRDRLTARKCERG